MYVRALIYYYIQLYELNTGMVKQYTFDKSLDDYILFSKAKYRHGDVVSHSMLDSEYMD